MHIIHIDNKVCFTPVKDGVVALGCSVHNLSVILKIDGFDSSAVLQQLDC